MIPFRFLAPIAVIIIAIAGVVMGAWKIDSIGLLAMMAGSYLFFGPRLQKIAGIVLIGIGIALWMDWMASPIPNFVVVG